MSTKNDISKPHKCLVKTCKGRLLEPIENYGKWAYWHGDGHPIGWHSKPVPDKK